MRQNMGFIITYSLMVATIMMLWGCTQLGKRDSQMRRWEVELISLPDGECRMDVVVDGEDTVTDDTVTLDHPMKGK